MGSTQEVTIDYSAGTARHIWGGVRREHIPREGGNAFSASLFATGADSSFQGNNYTEELQTLGLTTPNTLKQTFDINPTFGGPIARDKIWFYASARFQNNQNYVAGIFENVNAGNVDAWTYVPDTSKRACLQHSPEERERPPSPARSTPKNKVAVFFEKQWRTWDDGRQAVSPEAFVRYRFPTNQIMLASWTSPLSNRLLLEVRGSYHGEVWMNIGGDELQSNNRQLIGVTEQGGAIPGLSYRSLSGVYAKQSAPAIMQAQSALSYVTGAHAFKVGYDYLGGTHHNPNTAVDAAVQYRFNNGVPNLITEFATPYERVWRLNELGIYAQDKWTIGRLTANAGLRFDFYTTTFPEAHLGPGTLVPNRNLTFPETPFYNFRDLSPRLGVAYDLFGNGRTALKGAVSRYTVGIVPTDGHPVTNLASQVTRTWTDANRDYVPDCNLLNPQQNGECGIISDLTFGSTRPSTGVRPGHPDGMELSAWRTGSSRPACSTNSRAASRPERRLFPPRAIQTSSSPTTAPSAATDYTAFGFTAPVDSRLPGGGGYPVGGYYNLNPNKVGQVDNYVTAAEQLRVADRALEWRGCQHERAAAGGARTGRSRAPGARQPTAATSPSSCLRYSVLSRSVNVMWIRNF